MIVSLFLIKLPHPARNKSSGQLHFHNVHLTIKIIYLGLLDLLWNRSFLLVQRGLVAQEALKLNTYVIQAAERIIRVIAWDIGNPNFESMTHIYMEINSLTCSLASSLCTFG